MKILDGRGRWPGPNHLARFARSVSRLSSGINDIGPHSGTPDCSYPAQIVQLPDGYAAVAQQGVGHGHVEEEIGDGEA